MLSKPELVNSSDLVSEDLNHGCVSEGVVAILLSFTPEHRLGGEEEAAQANMGDITPAGGADTTTGAGEDQEEYYFEND